MSDTPYIAQPAQHVGSAQRPSRRSTGTHVHEDILSDRGTTIGLLSSSYTRESSAPNGSLTDAISSSGRTRLTVEKKLCNFCIDTIVTADLKWGLHHTNLETLQKSAAEGCAFCCQLHDDVRSQHRENIKTLNWPLYRWTIRSPERIGESEDVYAGIVFRQVQDLVISHGHRRQTYGRLPESTSARLPERTFYLFQQSDPARMQSLRPLGNHTFSVESQQTIREWIEECDKNHHNCAGRVDKGFTPTRLLDLNYHKDLVLVVDTHRNFIQEPYTTLSYCWGSKPFTKLEPHTVNQFMGEGLPITRLPKTMREAIQTTRMLGVRYIWIDSLCIIQGDKGDFEFEASLMLQVYRNSTVNLAASDTTFADGGLYRYRKEEELFDAECQGRPNSKIFGNAIWRIVPKVLWDEQVLHTQLNSRGWVFQERLLSPRILHFPKQQIFWDCATVSACETFRRGLPKPLDTGNNDRYWRWKLQDASDLNVFLPTIIDQSLEQFWRNAIRTYSNCRLTKYSDKLVAIWGIVRFLIGALKERYAVGLWERNLEEQLAWYVVDCTASRPVAELNAPSWSWATINGEVVLPDRFAAVRDYHVLDHDGQEISFDLYGPTRHEDQGPRTWNEQLQQYETRLKEIEAYSRSFTTLPPRTKHQEHLDLDPIPQLRSHSIPMTTYIGTMHLDKLRGTSRWTRDPAIDHGLLEVFPDLDPGEGPIGARYNYLILAMSMTSSDDPHGDTQKWPTELCSGVGLLLKPGTSEGHFVRKGMFRFSSVPYLEFVRDFRSYRAYSDLGRKFSDHGGKGFKIWLD